MNIGHFQKPSRYIGSEFNCACVRHDAGVRTALCFPDTYEIGMSHLGLKILYSIINNIPYASAERVFAPWVDYEKFLRQKGLLLLSLESGTPLKDFDIVGFSLQYELSYTNVLNMLDLGGIPVRGEDRGDGHPLIIAGGPCTANPLPLIPFIDAFVIGEGEEVISEIIDIVKNFKFHPEQVGTNFKFSKKDLLKTLANLKGVYVPLVHEKKKKRIKRRIVEDLNGVPFPESPIVPFASIVHDRIAIEVLRGCTRGCRFCQAGVIYRPLRERSLEKVLSLACKLISNTGYEEVSFASLSTGDYSCLLPLIKTFNRIFLNNNIAVSLPSLRVESVSGEVLNAIKSVRKTGFTIAPEAGTERLRNIINKNFAAEDYEHSLEKLFSAGWKSIKLYFMTGLPTETEQDIDGIVSMVEHASKKGRELTRSSVNINVGVSAFVPKPHTPFQWFGQMPFEELRRRQDYLRNSLQSRGFGINFKGQHVELSLLESVFSRGDEKTASLIETAWRLGACFDGWSETFDFAKWQKAADMTGIDLMDYASREIDISEGLPWEIIDTGITKEFLINELNKAFREQTTEDCRIVCHDCGLKCRTTVHSSPRPRSASPTIGSMAGAKRGGQFTANSYKLTRDLRLTAGNQQFKKARWIRVIYSKTGALKYLSHLEVMRALLRAIRRADIPLVYTKGFHPHPKVSFGPALPVG
ncbi:MAG: TIGR03960 family B12-binding radical SAM protein, partial [Nitrospirae bacterium]|nr:TIGR03960 family B12-binding radical SAM protein [Nitrospirota bacterium]